MYRNHRNFASICRCIGRCLDRWRMSLDRHETQHSEDPACPLLHLAFTRRTMWVFLPSFFSRQPLPSPFLLRKFARCPPSSSSHFGRDLNRHSSSVSSHGWSRANCRSNVEIAVTNLCTRRPVRIRRIRESSRPFVSSLVNSERYNCLAQMNDAIVNRYHNYCKCRIDN